MFHTALLPADLTDDAAVFEFAKGLPALGVRRLVVAHILDATGLEGPVIDAEEAAARARLRDAVEPLSDEGLEVEARVVTGDPADELLALASEPRIDVVVCPTNARAVRDEVLSGGVADRLVRSARVPRLAVRNEVLAASGALAPALARDFGRTLLVAIDFSKASLDAFEAALALPAEAVGSMILMHVIDPGLTPEERARREKDAARELEKLCERAGERGIECRALVDAAAPEAALVLAAAREGATGVVLGARGLSPLREALLGSVSMTLLRQADCPLLIVS